MDKPKARWSMSMSYVQWSFILAALNKYQETLAERNDTYGRDIVEGIAEKLNRRVHA